MIKIQRLRMRMKISNQKTITKKSGINNMLMLKKITKKLHGNQFLILMHTDTSKIKRDGK